MAYHYQNKLSQHGKLMIIFILNAISDSRATTSRYVAERQILTCDTQNRSLHIKDNTTLNAASLIMVLPDWTKQLCHFNRTLYLVITDLFYFLLKKSQISDRVKWTQKMRVILGEAYLILFWSESSCNTTTFSQHSCPVLNVMYNRSIITA